METTSLIIKEFLKNINIIKDYVLQWEGGNIEEYLGKHLEDLSLRKTLLHRNKPIHIKDLYYPLRIRDNENKSILVDSITKVFQDSENIIISGLAGSGKSTMSRFLFYNSIKTSYYIPVFIQLREIETESFERFVKNKFVNYGLAQNHNIAESMLKKDPFVIFLDGFDEVNNNKMRELGKEIQKFTEKFIKSKYILTTRPDMNIYGLELFSVYYIEELKKDEIEKFINSTGIEEKIIKKIIDNIFTVEDKDIISYIKNPLFLSLYILTFSRYSRVPIKISEFYRRVIEVLFIEHDSMSKFGFEREFKTGFSDCLMKEILGLFSYMTYFKEKFEFRQIDLENEFKIIKEKMDIEFSNRDLIYDFTNSVSIWILDCGIYSFLHKSLQEYFVANSIKKLDHQRKKKSLELLLKKKIANEYDHKNVLKLFAEMDEVMYIKYYLLPFYEYILNSLKKLDRENRIRFYINNKYNNVKVTINKNYNIMKFSYHKFDMFKFIDIGDYNQINADEIDEISEKYIEIFAKKNNYRKFFDTKILEFSLVEESQNNIQYFYDTTIENNIKLIIDFTETKIDDLKIKLSHIDKHNDDLLELI